MMHECDSCKETGIHTPATTHSINPDFAGYCLCEACAAEYDARMPQPPAESDNA
jgi:hypothetical protein